MFHNHGLWNLPPVLGSEKKIHGFWAWNPRSHCWKKGQLLHLFVPTLCTISENTNDEDGHLLANGTSKTKTRGFSSQETTKNQTISTDVWGLLPPFKWLSDICVNLVCAGLRPNQKSHNFKVHAGEPVWEKSSYSSGHASVPLSIGGSQKSDRIKVPHLSCYV